MIAIVALDNPWPVATDGDIAVRNLESSRRGAWARFARNGHVSGAFEAAVESERLAAQFLGDLSALDRLESLAGQFERADDSYRAALIRAQVASDAHRFSEARGHLARAAKLGAPSEGIELQALAIDQACGVRLEAVLAARRRTAEVSGRLEDRVPLGALLADLECYEEAEATYRKAFYSYDGISPFPLAWVCFQLGALCGEIVTEPDAELAELWYARAIAYLPAYVKARVHLAEIYTQQQRLDEAEALLLPALDSADPEVRWRLADALTAQGRREEAAAALDAARADFEALLERHLLAFADHAAEFYAGSGDDLPRALELARTNAANRPTRLALKQMHSIAARMTH